MNQSIGGEIGLFAIRGNLDGEEEQDYSEREQFIGLKIGKEEFYMPIAAVNEIVMLQPITYVPQSHKYIEGVVNLRGIIMPAINVRKMMGLARGQVSSSNRMIIADHQETQVALLVDGITYVISLAPSEIEDQALPGRSLGADFISRMAKGREKVVGIIDLAKLVSHLVDEKTLNEAKSKENDGDDE